MTNGADADRDAAAKALAFIRLTLGMMFVWVFFENLGKGLYTPAGYAGLIKVYLDHGQAPAFWKSFMAMAAAKSAVTAPLQGFTEISLGGLLVLGLLTRPAALVAFLFLTSLWVSEWGTAWIWELLVPMMAALGLLMGRAGRKWGLDGFLARRYPGSRLW
ncbi:MAG TPA: TQO small subunit DoxD [Acidobacteriota bacterium]|jgi:uncharacterized membrane protein YphA (DoxX/SURF4 family)